MTIDQSEQATTPQAPTLEMVAHVAGVSRATVSRVVNGSTAVTPQVTALVNAAIEKLNYVPNRAARSLASRRTNVIALIVPEQTSTVFSDPFFASVIQGVAVYLNDTDYTLNLLIASESSSDKTRRYLLGGNVDGALVVSHHSGDHSYTRLGQKLPIVFGGRPLTPELDDSYFVDVDNVAAARSATGHLISLGRTRIATVAGPQDMPPGVDRLRGWREAMDAAGLADDLVEIGGFSPASGADAIGRLLDRDASIDAVFFANDQMAAGAYPVLRERGRAIPGDIAVAGFDDDPLGTALSPTLTTVHQPSSELGAGMAAALVRLIAGDTLEHEQIMSTTLVIRESSGGEPTA
ncbi:LacI family DNA-binding transcriptional regulator [Agreia sp. Leaf283]|uniref:LacI family DNA-binding transcriptional regulator n=1 Tax=Agreia sp. Leaf283 TaxID=1736321 RepID=UPI00070098D3|nr:LacI family DNA-binding transcriptional regulator [Agreia sp. Leaf283]KQP56839.1 LacI family transcriptional regulator [Agreia sp. Leaf283]